MKLIGDTVSKTGAGKTTLRYTTELDVTHGLALAEVVRDIQAVVTADMQRSRWSMEMAPEELIALRRDPAYVEIMRYGAVDDELTLLARYLYVDEVRIVPPEPAPQTAEEWRAAFRENEGIIHALWSALNKVSPDAAHEATRNARMQQIRGRAPMPVESVELVRGGDGRVRAVQMIAPQKEGEPGPRVMRFTASAADGLGRVKLLEPCEVSAC